MKRMNKYDYVRLRAKIFYKIRMIYLNYFHNKKDRIWLYKSYRHLKGNDKKCKDNNKQYMTKLVNPSAGIGDQLSSWITGYFYSKQFDLTYAYELLYPLEWNSFLALDSGEKSANSLLKEHGYKKIWLPYFTEDNKNDYAIIRKIIDSYKGKKVIFYIEISQVYGAQYGVMDFLKEKFYNSPLRKQDNFVYDKKDINIAMHIRRGDIGSEYQNPELAIRWLDNSYYENILKQILTLVKKNGTEIKIYLFSQGERENFWEFEQFKNVIYCLDMSAVDSFLHLVMADILITSKSSFSYNPALLSEGIKICPRNFWHRYPDDSKWILADNYGNIDVDKFISIFKRGAKN